MNGSVNETADNEETKPSLEELFTLALSQDSERGGNYRLLRDQIVAYGEKALPFLKTNLNGDWRKRVIAQSMIGRILQPAKYEEFEKTLHQHHENLLWAPKGVRSRYGSKPSQPATPRVLLLDQKKVLQHSKPLSGLDNNEAFSFLIEASLWPRGTIGQVAVLGLSLFKKPEAYEPLILLLQSKSKELRGYALYGLKLLHDKRAVTSLVSLMLNGLNYSERRFAAEILGELGDMSIIPDLQKAMAEDKDDKVREAAEKTIQAIKKRGI